MQPQSPRGPTPAVLVTIVLVTWILGAVCGGFLTYGVMSVTSRNRQAYEPTTTVPQAVGFDHATSKPLDGDWRSYDFPDIGLTIELPCAVSGRKRTFPSWAASRVQKTSDYGGGKTYGIYLGAYWTDHPTETDPIRTLNYGLKHPVAGYSELAYSIDRLTIDGNPAAGATGTYKKEGYDGGMRTIYIQHGNALCYLQTSYWMSVEPQVAKDWKRIIASIHFRGK